MKTAAVTHPEFYQVRSSSAVLPLDIMFDEDAEVLEEINVNL